MELPLSDPCVGRGRYSYEPLPPKRYGDRERVLPSYEALGFMSLYHIALATLSYGREGANVFAPLRPGSPRSFLRNVAIPGCLAQEPSHSVRRTGCSVRKYSRQILSKIVFRIKFYAGQTIAVAVMGSRLLAVPTKTWNACFFGATGDVASAFPKGKPAAIIGGHGSYMERSLLATSSMSGRLAAFCEWMKILRGGKILPL